MPEKLVADVGDCLWPRYGVEHTESQVELLGEAMHSTINLGDPSPSGGSLCPEGTFRIYDKPYPPAQVLFGGSFWDCAVKTGIKNDYSVGTEMVLCDDGNLYVETQIRERLEYDDLEVAALNSYYKMKERFPQACICLGIEDTQAGTQLIQRIRRANLNGRADIDCVEYGLNGKSKPFRTRRVAKNCSRTFLLKGSWNATLMHEFKVFPHDSTHDDTVDSICIGYDIIEVYGPAVLTRLALASADDLDMDEGLRLLREKDEFSNEFGDD